MPHLHFLLSDAHAHNLRAFLILKDSQNNSVHYFGDNRAIEYFVKGATSVEQKRVLLNVQVRFACTQMSNHKQPIMLHIVIHAAMGAISAILI